MKLSLQSFLNKKIEPPQLRAGYHVHIEQYRGLCALLVLMEHGLAHQDMLIDNFKWPGFVHYIGAGHLSVIIFFCISGYVIGISNSKKQLNIGLYIKKRLVRLYPIYIFSILVCLLVISNVSLRILIENLLFLENFSPYGKLNIPVFVNFASWSLNYEVVYYLLFIGLFFIQPKVWHLLLGVFILSIAMYHTQPGIVFIVHYVNGFYFWVLGLFIGWQIIAAKEDQNLKIPLLSVLFLHLCIQHVGFGLMILKILKISTASNFDWLFDIPFCLMVMGILTKKDNSILRFNKILCYVMPVFVFIYLFIQHRVFEHERWIMCIIFWVLSVIFYNEKRISAFLLEKLTVVGKISYALYLLHVPVAALLKKTVFINIQPLEVVVKYLLWITITFGVAYFLEIVCQPRIRKYLLPG